MFTYSIEPGTPAARLDEQIDEPTKERRRNELMEIQQKVVFDRNETMVGKTLDIIIDRAVEGEKNVWLGRSTADAPDVDGMVFVTDPSGEVAVGDIATCEIVSFKDYDLIAVATERR